MSSENKVLVESFLKLAGVAGLLDIAQNEENTPEQQKLAMETFDKIAQLKPSEMGAELIKVAGQIYPQETLREIVAGQYTDELFEKTASVVSWNDMSAPELEELVKTAANASGVAAKGIGGELADAKAQIQEKIKKEKEKAESISLGRQGVKKADDLTGYNVINNPGEYKVDKTASDLALEEAYMKKEAHLQEALKWDAFISNNIHTYKQQ